jgi:ricin-type beta-trefoil lectin protein
MVLRRIIALLVTVAGTVGLTVAVPAVSAQAYSVGTVYKIVNLYDGECLDAVSSGYQVFEEPCAQGAANQKWLLESTSASGYYKFANQGYAGCLDAPDGYYFPDAFNDACSTGASAERWALQSTSTSGYYKLLNQFNGNACLFDYGQAVAEVANCAQGATNQKWKLQLAS